jgi:hypothetical protein
MNGTTPLPCPAHNPRAVATRSPARSIPAVVTPVNQRAEPGRHAQNFERADAVPDTAPGYPIRRHPRGMPIAPAALTPVQRLAHGIPGTPGSDSYDCPVSPRGNLRPPRVDANWMMGTVIVLVVAAFSLGFIR